MKKIFLMALTGAITLASFASDKGKHKAKTHHSTEQTCPKGCPRGSCHIA